jgi:tagatose 6-phosphate kinase
VIVTVTLNPALHVEYAADHIATGAVNQVRRVRYSAGGRGLAVAQVLHTFGHDVVAAGLAGGSAGELIKIELARAGVATQFTRIAAESKRVLAVTNGADGRVTSFAEPAPYITTEELGRLAADYRALLADATAVVLCGSLPESLPAELYGSFASYAAEAGVPVILDAGGSPLAYGAARRPALVVPAMPFGLDADLADGTAAGFAGAMGLILSGAGAVALLTGQGVCVLTADAEWRARLRNPAASAPDGPAMAADRGIAGGLAGEALRDALVAGLVPGIALGWSWPDTLRHAVALGAAWNLDGELDVEAYEGVLTAISVDQSPGGLT